MRAVVHERGNGTTTALRCLAQPVPRYHTARARATGTGQLPTATVKGLNYDDSGTLSPRASLLCQGRARGWQGASAFRDLGDSLRRPKLGKRRTSRTRSSRATSDTLRHPYGTRSQQLTCRCDVLPPVKYSRVPVDYQMTRRDSTCIKSKRQITNGRRFRPRTAESPDALLVDSRYGHKPRKSPCSIPHDYGSKTLRTRCQEP